MEIEAKKPNRGSEIRKPGKPTQQSQPVDMCHGFRRQHRQTDVNDETSLPLSRSLVAVVGSDINSRPLELGGHLKTKRSNRSKYEGLCWS